MVYVREVVNGDNGLRSCKCQCNGHIVSLLLSGMTWIRQMPFFLTCTPTIMYVFDPTQQALSVAPKWSVHPLHALGRLQTKGNFKRKLYSTTSTCIFESGITSTSILKAPLPSTWQTLPQNPITPTPLSGSTPPSQPAPPRS